MLWATAQSSQWMNASCFKLNTANRMRAVPQAAAAAVPGHAGTWNAGPQLVVGVSCCDRLFIPEETLTQEYGRQACLIGWLVLRRKNMFRILHELPFLELPNEQVCHCPTSEWLEFQAGIFYFNLFFNFSRHNTTVETQLLQSRWVFWRIFFTVSNCWC